MQACRRIPRSSNLIFLSLGLGVSNLYSGAVILRLLFAGLKFLTLFTALLFIPTTNASALFNKDEYPQSRATLITSIEGLLVTMPMPTVKNFTALSTNHVDESGYQNAARELLEAFHFRTILLDIYKNRSKERPAIKHFDAVTEHNFKAKMAHKRYHHICDRKLPKGLPPCHKAKWRYGQAVSCLRAREAWEERWGTLETAAPHERALKNVRAWLKNAEKDRQRSCELDRLNGS